MEIKPCRSCQAPVIWARTKNGKAIPIDAEPADSGQKPNLKLLPGNPVAAEYVGAGEGTHVSHFVTCPNAIKHRTARTTKGNG